MLKLMKVVFMAIGVFAVGVGALAGAAFFLTAKDVEPTARSDRPTAGMNTEELIEYYDQHLAWIDNPQFVNECTDYEREQIRLGVIDECVGYTPPAESSEPIQSGCTDFAGDGEVNLNGCPVTVDEQEALELLSEGIPVGIPEELRPASDIPLPVIELELPSIADKLIDAVSGDADPFTINKPVDDAQLEGFECAQPNLVTTGDPCAHEKSGCESSQFIASCTEPQSSRAIVTP